MNEIRNDWQFELFPASALNSSIGDRFAQVARMWRGRSAIDDGQLALSYGELANMANAIAVAIEAEVQSRAGPVAVLLGHDARFPAAILGVMAAKRACVPLDCETPPDRNQSIAASAAVAAIVSCGPLATEARRLFAALPVIDIEALASDEPPARTACAGPDDIAVILYTSGSTGAPKGVYQSHRGVLRDIMEAINSQRIGREDHLALFNAPTIISSFRVALSALLAGAQLHVFSPRELGGAKLISELQRRRITIFRSVPALFRYVVESLGQDERLETVRMVVLGGDRVDWADFDVFKRGCLPDASFGVHLGATECWTLYLEWFVDERLRTANGKLPVGRVIEGRNVTLVGEGGQTVADGEVGEFVVASRHLALGYWRDPELTARAFADDPEDRERRMYFTGDLGVRRSDGLFEYVGRKDQQIKLYGHRIEPAEIERALCGCAEVRDAAVLPRMKENNVPQSLAAYVEAELGLHDLTPATLTSRLAQQLPAYMVPATIVLVDELPRLPNLKIDRVRLMQMDRDRRAQAFGVIGDPLVNEVAEIFKQVLGVPVAAPEDNVASLGGDSFRAVSVALELERRFGVVSPYLFNPSQTIGDIAGWISLHTLPDPSPPIRAEAFERDKPQEQRLLPFSLLQEHLWAVAHPEHTAVTRDRIFGALDVEALRECMTYLVGRHETLRTSFTILNGQPMQIVNAPAPVALTYIDLADAADAERRALLVFEQEAKSEIALTQTSLLRFVLIRINPEEHWLIRIGHHILFDGSSWNLYFEELAALYAARVQGRSPPLPPYGSQYADYVAWERQALRGPAYRQQIEWWRALFRQNLPALQLPFRREEPLEGVRPEEGDIRWRSQQPVLRGLSELCRQQGTTYYTLVMAAYVVLLSVESGQADIVLGTYASVRKRPELQKIFGILVNLVPIVLRCETRKTFRQWLSNVRDRLTEIQTNWLPHEQLVREMRAHDIRIPEIRGILTQRVLRPVYRFSGLEIVWSPLAGPPRMPPGFELSVGGIGEEIVLRFDANRYDSIGAGNLIKRLRRFLKAVSKNPDWTVDRLLLESVGESVIV